MTNLADFVKVAAVDDIEPGEVITRRVGDRSVAIANVGGTFYAFDAHCSHQRAMLEDGELEGTTIHCPWHPGSFDVRTGCVLTGPALRDIRTYPLSRRDGWIEVSLADHE